ncbi:haca ribonucleo complex subunit 4 [Olea europaea subsp. europaea]|uniref:tRNA pseudouridine(55) synthase n=1 Tax=Olea europaea subsp. europaea TaxID=158383 RepID=A0A8S0R7Y9_OLEEU|nr:haca ribonucleo complex subunit 4 [Olea europaea subsp. europaea]
MASTPLPLARTSLLVRRFKAMYILQTPPFRTHSFQLNRSKPFSARLLSTTSTPFPLQYEMIISRPSSPPPRPSSPSRRLPAIPNSRPADSEPDPELGFEDWVDKKLSNKNKSDDDTETDIVMDKAKRKYYNKRRKRMYGESESDEESGGRGKEGDYVELKQEIVELRTLHKKEEELYFHDAFAYPWEKDKHYKMVYQLEKKYFPDQCFDKAFLEPGQSNGNGNVKKEKKGMETKEVKVKDDKGLMFFEGSEGEREGKNSKVCDVTEKKVEDFFKCLKKVPNASNGDATVVEPFFSTRSVGLPPKWDGPNGTVVLVNKPKGWTSFTVCGKLRRLVNVKKVGHAGTLDPMATGLLIVCIGKATKLVERYQGMIKGYSGIFRLGEATSTWDADSPVIQREPWEHIKDENIKKAAASFCGEIWQVPPMFSAIKVRFLSHFLVSILSLGKFPEFMNVMKHTLCITKRRTCSKGTYIRSLCADFGKALGSCAHLIALRRDSIGIHSADDAWEFQELEEAIKKGYF